ncbi:YpmS family protein [Candidatus Enterococcus ikei]|uniref:YpmS family protein n=1 Tax=Candidatus Enterococcus ikei TaxID=2815326 RepID=A0ABS3H3P1_9ENTE|nr:YpmS family protein [Enterococcus sp. DIV0869a]MBO0441309.1 YpmS family protein [Enterococcus sp. DIV0869a]
MSNESEEKKEVNKTKQRRKKTPEVKKPSNPWKIALLILIGLIIGSFAFIFVRVTQVREPNYKPVPELVEKEGTPVIAIQSNKKQVNALIDFYLSDFQKGSDITYKFYLENEAMLNGTFEVLGHPIQFYLYFDPYVMDNGNVQLKAKSLSVGTLGLPMKEILKFVQRDYKLPSWVEVNPEDSTVLLRLDQFRMQNGLFIRAEKINLVDDDIRMNIYLPKDSTD